LKELFRDLPGVVITEVGYSGGNNTNPTYEFHPGHAEVIKITYDTKITNLLNILDFFFRIHDPTTINRQGNDVGTSYRSVIFYNNVAQLNDAKQVINATNLSGLYDNPVVTALEKLTKFYSAEAYHQNYLQNNPGGYTCHYVRTDKSLLG